MLGIISLGCLAASCTASSDDQVRVEDDKPRYEFSFWGLNNVRNLGINSDIVVRGHVGKIVAEVPGSFPDNPEDRTEIPYRVHEVTVTEVLFGEPTPVIYVHTFDDRVGQFPKGSVISEGEELVLFARILADGDYLAPDVRALVPHLYGTTDTTNGILDVDASGTRALPRGVIHSLDGPSSVEVTNPDGSTVIVAPASPKEGFAIEDIAAYLATHVDEPVGPRGFIVLEREPADDPDWPGSFDVAPLS
jgi:hypothetical protein